MRRINWWVIFAAIFCFLFWFFCVAAILTVWTEYL